MLSFEDNFTLDGLLTPASGVTMESVGKVAKLIESAKRGSYVAEAQLKESMMTGVLASSVAHFINLITIPQLPDDKDRPVAKLASFRIVPDFRPAVLYSMFGSLTGPGITEDGAAPRVPQGQPFPEVTITGVESAYAKLSKRGNRVNWDFEDFINDTVGMLDGIPAELRDVALETEWQEVGEALVKATTASGSVTLPDATVVPSNAAISADAIMAAIMALSLRTVNGTKKKIGTLSGYNVIVPFSKKVYVDHMIRQALNVLYVLPGSGGGAVTAPTDRSVLETVEVIEHDKVTGTKWYLAPKPGSYRRPVLDVLRLRGYETPQIRVRTEGGDGFSFDADTAAMRLRLVTGAALWFQEAIVYSAGTA
jgi:hypothetical protein